MAEEEMFTFPPLSSEHYDCHHYPLLRRRDTIFKSIDSRVIFVEGEGHKAAYTQRVTPEVLSLLDSAVLTPVVFQHLVPKAFEVRSIYMFGRVYSVRIDSRQVSGAEVDWRTKPEEMQSHMSPYELPDVVRHRLEAFMRRMNLGYGAVDWIVDPEGAHVFLEVNTTGSWYWMEQATGLPITATIVDVLLERAGREDVVT